ncbi:hypothetical protein BU26DRAFT_225760 [Trematosphaeria pertusa]|uniref:Uncharacterized protein n=1 Tax=Trematosphaeria pertusa TaxID=390896 RepID=A0A6A6IVF6_9PLEO|nr:uncharacterized protein BU26DRAFT_225760 [Trematosphaeria pertusa]KAF2253600.1 hypothetical protein BU26DRAFT_225760 [Trematosphaeria pertusa]
MAIAVGVADGDVVLRCCGEEEGLQRMVRSLLLPQVRQVRLKNSEGSHGPPLFSQTSLQRRCCLGEDHASFEQHPRSHVHPHLAAFQTTPLIPTTSPANPLVADSSPASSPYNSLTHRLTRQPQGLARCKQLGNTKVVLRCCEPAVRLAQEGRWFIQAKEMLSMGRANWVDSCRATIYSLCSSSEADH